MLALKKIEQYSIESTALFQVFFSDVDLFKCFHSSRQPEWGGREAGGLACERPVEVEQWHLGWGFDQGGFIQHCCLGECDKRGTVGLDDEGTFEKIVTARRPGSFRCQKAAWCHVPNCGPDPCTSTKWEVGPFSQFEFDAVAWM